MKVLVATDFSSSAAEVMRVAAELAQGVSADIHILHVAVPETNLIGVDRSKEPEGDVVETNRKEKLLVREAAQSMIARGLMAKGEVVAGPCADVILQRANEIAADLIVVGSHGFGAVLRALLGSVSAAILKKARCPVVIVPPLGKNRA